jgi:site-specific DNA-methyltransferase (adenine-specific)
VKLEIIAIADLVPDPNNARTHDQKNLEAIAGSLKEFGQRKPIVITQDNIIAAGNGTVAAAKSLGWNEIEVVRVPADWDADRIKAFALADNRTAELATWNQEVMASQLLELQEAGFEIEEFGFELIDPPIDPEAIIEDEIPTEVITRTASGDLWKLGRHYLKCGDATSFHDAESLVGATKADLIFTDPPYGVDYKGINNDDLAGLEKLLQGAFENYVKVAKPGASAYVFHSDKNADIFHKVFRQFFHFSSMIIWAKNSLTLSRTDYQSQHEPCLYGWVLNGTHNFYGDRKQVSVWRFDKERVEGHTTPKPVALIANAIKNSSKSGDIVVDFFSGSGSTLIACEQTNRDARAMELDPKYCDVIIQRWENLTGQKAELVNASR